MSFHSGSYNATITDYYVHKNRLLIDLLRCRYKHAFFIITKEILTDLDQTKMDLAYEEALRHTNFILLDKKCKNLKEIEDCLRKYYVGLLSIMQNSSDQIRFLELKKAIYKKLRTELKKQFSEAFKDLLQYEIAHRDQTYIFSFEDYINETPQAKLFIRGLFYYPLYSFVNDIIKNPEESDKIVNTILENQYHRRKNYLDFRAITHYLYPMSRSKAFEYLKKQHPNVLEIFFLFDSEGPSRNNSK